MIHGIHAAAMRENPLQIVVFGGFSTHIYDTQSVHYPGNLGNCMGYYTDTGFQLPLAPYVLATSVNTGDNRQGQLMVWLSRQPLQYVRAVMTMQSRLRTCNQTAGALPRHRRILTTVRWWSSVRCAMAMAMAKLML
jgi:hypothetical protein